MYRLPATSRLRLFPPFPKPIAALRHHHTFYYSQSSLKASSLIYSMFSLYLSRLNDIVSYLSSQQFPENSFKQYLRYFFQENIQVFPNFPNENMHQRPSLGFDFCSKILHFFQITAYIIITLHSNSKVQKSILISEQSNYHFDYLSL